MFLRCAEDQGLLALVDHVDEDFDAIGLAFGDFDCPVEVAFGVALSLLDLARDDFVVWRPDVIVDGRTDLADLERRQVAVIDPLLQ
jgi:hypothetical protein